MQSNRQLFYFIALVVLVGVTVAFSIHSLATSKSSSSTNNNGTQSETQQQINQNPGVSPVSDSSTTETVHIGVPNTPTPLKYSDNNTTRASALSVTKLIGDTNAERAKAGVPALTENDLLDLSAKSKVEDMFARQYFEHTSPTGQTVTTLVQSVGYNYILIGENLALGSFPNEQSVIDAWMASPEHKANMLDPRYTDIGMAAKEGIYEGQPTWMIVQHFGLPISVCATYAIDANLKSTIATESAALAKEQKQIAAQEQSITTMGSSAPQYQSEIQTYNAAAQNYDNQLADLQTKIAAYNKEVKAYNNCLNAELKTK